MSTREPRTAARGALLEGPITSTLLRLAWPVFISMLLHTLFNLVNAAWVGRLGPGPLAAVTTSIFATWTLIGGAEMVATGLIALVARHIGAGEPERAGHAAGQGILLACGLGLLTALASRHVPAALFHSLNTPADVTSDGIRYLQPLLLFSLPIFLMITLEGILRAQGDTRTPMRVTLIAVGVNLVLDPFLIFGWGPFPTLGVAGAATATLISQTLGTILFARHFRRRRSVSSTSYAVSPSPASPRPAAALLPRMGRPDPAVLLKILRIGAPRTLSTILFSVVYLLLSKVAAELGTGPLAILGVGNRLESISYLTGSALATAASALVGQNLGAGQPERALESARLATRAGALVTGLIGLLFFVLGRQMFQAFTDDPEIYRQGGDYMKVLALCQPFMGVEIALFGSFAGAGYTLAPTWISVGINLLRIPLAFWVSLSLGLGLMGLVWVLSLTCAARALLLLVLYRRRRWLLATL